MTREWLEQWGRNVRLSRKARGISQKALADLVGVTKPTVSRWEAGLIIPSDAHKVAIATHLNTDVRILFPLVRGVA